MTLLYSGNTAERQRICAFSKFMLAQSGAAIPRVFGFLQWLSNCFAVFPCIRMDRRVLIGFAQENAGPWKLRFITYVDIWERNIKKSNEESRTKERKESKWSPFVRREGIWGSRVISLIILNHGSRWGVICQVQPQTIFTPGKGLPLPNEYVAVWTPFAA
jgi:hypothetical protein